MAKEDTLSTPVIVEEDGWTIASGSSDRPTEEQLRSTLSDTPVPEKEPQKEPPPQEAEPTREDEQPEAEREEPETEREREPAIAASEEPPAEDTPAPAKKKRTHDPQRRIDKYHADLQRERERSAQLEAELQALRQPAAPRREPPVAPTAPPEPGPKPVWGGENGFESQGKTWEEYEAAKEDWTQQSIRAEMRSTIERRLAMERTRYESQTQVASQDAAYLARVEAARAKTPDYDRVVENLGDLDSPALKHLIYYSHDGPAIGLHLAKHIDQAETLVNTRFTPPIIDAVQRSPIPVKLLEHFAKHPEQIEQLAAQHPRDVMLAIGRLEARLDVGHSVTTAAAPVTSARPPLRTVGGGAPVTRSAPPASAADDLPFGPDYIAQANQDEARNRSRYRGY